MKIEVIHETKFNPGDTVYYIDSIAKEETCECCGITRATEREFVAKAALIDYITYSILGSRNKHTISVGYMLEFDNGSINTFNECNVYASAEEAQAIINKKGER